MKIKDILLIVLFALFLSSCSLFRKSEKHKVDVKRSVEIEQSIVTNEQKNEVESKERNTIVHTDKESNSQTTVEADEITITPDGSIRAKGNAKANQNRKDTDKGQQLEKETGSKVTNTDLNVVDHTKSSEKEQIRTVDKVPEKARNPVWHWIGAGLFWVIVIVAWNRLR